MAQRNGTEISSPVTTGDDGVKYGTHYDDLGIGGFRVVEDITKRDAIPVDGTSGKMNPDGLSSGRRKVLMEVAVRNADGLHGAKKYKLVIPTWNALTTQQKYDALANNANWVEVIQVSSSASATDFIFKPGATSANNIYSDFNALYTALSAVAGNKRVILDNTANAGAAIVLPAKSGGGNYDLNGVELTSISLERSVAVELATDCKIINLERISGNLSIISTSINASSHITLDGTSKIAIGELVVFAAYATGASIIEIADTQTLDLYISNLAQIKTGSVKPVLMSGTSTLNVSLDNLTTFENAIGKSGVGVSTVNVNIISPSAIYSAQTAVTATVNYLSLSKNVSVPKFSEGLNFKNVEDTLKKLSTYTNEFIYKPAETDPSGRVYNNFNLLYNDLILAPGFRKIVIDVPINDIVILPAKVGGGSYDFSNVELTSPRKFNTIGYTSKTRIRFAAGFSIAFSVGINSVFRIGGSLVLEDLSTGLPNAIITSGAARVELIEDSEIRCQVNGAPSFFEIDNTSMVIVMRDNAKIDGSGGNPVIKGVNASGMGVDFHLYDNATIADNSIAYTGGASTPPTSKVHIYSSAVTYSTTQNGLSSNITKFPKASNIKINPISGYSSTDVQTFLEEFNVSVGGGPKWRKQTISYSSFLSYATQVQALVINGLDAGAVLHAVKIRVTTQFAGTGITSLTATIGINTNYEKYAAPYNLMQVVSNTNTYLANAFFVENEGSSTPIYIQLSAQGGNLNALTQGAIEVCFLMSKP